MCAGWLVYKVAHPLFRKNLELYVKTVSKPCPSTGGNFFRSANHLLKDCIAMHGVYYWIFNAETKIAKLLDGGAYSALPS